MKITVIRKMKTVDIVSSVETTRVEIAELRRSIHMGETQNVRALRTKRKDLARMLGVISEQFAKEKI